jgi:membrane protein YdbS with pleckstrin-like domain
MRASAGTHRELDRYLLDGERVVTAVHQHWAKVAEPVASAVAGAILALWVDTHVDLALSAIATVVWWGWFALVARLLYRLAEWRHDWFVATDKRLLLFSGFITRRVSMMPLIKVTDMSYERSVPGRILGFGRFVMESAGHDQALRAVEWVPQPDHHYRIICAEIFGVADRARPVDDEDPRQDPWTGAPAEPLGIPDPYAGWDSPRHSPPHPSLPADPPTDSLYRSPDLQARDRSADTGPIPLRPRRERWHD